jgi:hypothetical protein
LALGELQAHDTPWSSQETSALGVLRTGAKKIAMKVIRFRWGKIKRAHEGGAMEYEDDAQKLAVLEIDGNRIVRSLGVWIV